MNCRAMHPTRWLTGLFLTLLSLASPHSAWADSTAEIQRLITNARAKQAQLAANRPQLEALRDRLEKGYAQVNDSQHEVSQILLQVRVMDARNKAMMTVKTGMLFTMVHSAATASLTSIAVDLGVMVVSEFLMNRYPALFDASLKTELPALSETVLVAVKKFQWHLSLTDAEISGMIRTENPELAQERGIYDLVTGGKLSDDLIALYRARLIIQSGQTAEADLQRLKEKVKSKWDEVNGALQDMDAEKKRLEADSASWIRHLSLNSALEKIPPPPPPPTPVTVDWSNSVDFPVAAANMRSAMARLKANEITHGDYRLLLTANEALAQRKLDQLWTERYRACGSGNWNDPVCRSADANYWAGRANYTTHVTGTQKQLQEEMEKIGKDAAAFSSKLAEIKQRVFQVGTYGAKKTGDFRLGSWERMDGQGLASSPYWNELGLTANVFTTDYRLPIGWPIQREFTEQVLESFTVLRHDLEHDLALAERVRSDTAAAAYDIDSLVPELERNLQAWSGFLPDASRLHQDMRTFKASYEAVAAHTHDHARELVKAAKEHHALLAGLSSAYAMEKDLLRMMNELHQAATALWTLQSQSGYRLNDPDIAYTLWKQMTAAGVTEAMVAELTEIIPKLGNEKFAVEYGMELSGSRDPRRKPVLDAGQLQKLRTDLLSSASSIVQVYNQYSGLYARMKNANDSLDRGYAAMRSRVESVIGSPTPWIANPYLVMEMYMHPNDFPDPSAGVFEQLDKYTALAASYRAIMDKLAPWTFPHLVNLVKVQERLNKEKGAGMSLGGEAFGPWLNGFSREIQVIVANATGGGTKSLPPDSPFTRTLGALWHQISEISREYHSARRIIVLLAELQGLAAGVDKFLARPDSEGGPAGASSWIDRLAPGLAEARQYPDHGGISGLLDRLTGQVKQLRAYLDKQAEADLNRVNKQAEADLNRVKDLYASFKSAYESRNDSQVMSFISDSWEAGDGTTLSDLQMNLSRSFRTFDEIRYDIQNLKIDALQDGRYSVGYDVVITSRIYRRNIKHEEKSSVREEVITDNSGKVKIFRTGAGRFWHTQ